MAKWRIESRPGATYGPAGGLPEAGYVTLNLVGVTDAGTEIPGKHIVGLPIPHADVTAALALDTDAKKVTAIKALIREALPDDWEGDLIVGYELAIDAAAALDEFIETVAPAYPPVDFPL